MRLDKTKAEEYRAIADRYSHATGQTEYEAKDVIQWAMDRGDLDTSPQVIFEFHRGCLVSALRSDVIKTPQGRKVRVRHSLEVRSNGDPDQPQQRHLWAHIDDARDEFLVASLHQRFNAIAADVEQLKADLDYINERRQGQGKRPIEMTFDFSSPSGGHAESA